MGCNRASTRFRRRLIDRDRGEPRGPSPPTPPCVRVPYSAVREVALTRLEQGGQTDRFEVRIGEPGREGSTAGEIPRTAAAAGRVPGSPWRDPVGDQCGTATTWCFPLTPQGGPQSQPDPASESDQHFGRFAEAKIVAPAPNEIMGPPTEAVLIRLAAADLRIPR